MRLWPLTAAVVAAAVAAGTLLLVHGGSTPEIAPSSTLAVRASFDRAAVQFGDPVTARIVVVLDRDAVRASTLRVIADLAPFTALAARKTTRTVAGRLETVTISQRVACFTAPCVAAKIKLPPVRVSVRGQTASAVWRAARVRSRVTAADVAAASPPFAADTAPAPPAYRVAPRTAEIALIVLAALAAAGAAALLAFEALARRRQAVVVADELTRALRLVREAEGRPVPDRRRALALLARLLPSAEARELAWREPPPEPETIDDLVARVERERAG